MREGVKYLPEINTDIFLVTLNKSEKQYSPTTMYLDYAERQAKKQIPMTMEDWAKKLDAFLQFNDEAVLQDKGRISAEVAKAFAESEFEKYRVIQDRLYQSDFDQLFQLESKN